MPTLNIPKNYAALTTPTEAQLDAVKNSIETFFNITKVGADNFSTGSFTSATIADGAITAVQVADISITSTKKSPCNIITSTVASGGTVSATITTTGRPVWVISCPAIGGALSEISTFLPYIELRRDSTVLARTVTATGASPFGIFLDAPVAGTHTYTMEKGGGSGIMTNISLHVIEL